MCQIRLKRNAFTVYIRALKGFRLKLLGVKWAPTDFWGIADILKLQIIEWI